MKRIFITGAAGFIGFHLANALRKRGDYVVGYDNFNDYYAPQLKEDRAKELAKVGVEVIKGDICDFVHLNESVARHQMSHLVHLAAQAGVRYSLKNPRVYLKANIDGFFNVLEICRHHAPIKLTYASSSSVYGMNAKIPFSVGDPADKPANLYGATKKANELMAYAYHHLYGISMSGLRFFTVYGPWGRPDMAYFSFTKAILAGEPIDLYNHGNMKRDFTYIDDIIAGTCAAIDLESEFEIFNLGHHHPVELTHFIKILEEALGRKARKNLLPMQNGDIATTFADIDSSKEKLGFVPKTSIEEGLPRFVDWYLRYDGLKRSEVPRRRSSS